MKNILFINLIFFLTSCNSKASEDKIIEVKEPTQIVLNTIKTDIGQLDLSKVFFPDSIQTSEEVIEKSEALGFIGNNYQRFQIHFTTCRKSDTNNLVYIVSGKTRVKNIICNFQGTIEIFSTKFNKDSIWILDEIEPSKNLTQTTLNSKIALYEDENEFHSGYIEGILTTNAYIDSINKIHYNAFGFHGDGYYNNQFEGKWTDYKTKESKKCNWGDYRIPDAKNLDQGVGEFGIDDKYVKNGWQNYKLAWCGTNDEKKMDEARKIEKEKWWK